jgi:hypothetical protein
VIDGFPTSGTTIIDTFGTPTTDSTTVDIPIGNGQTITITIPTTVITGGNTTIIDVPTGDGTSIYVSFGDPNDPPDTTPGGDGSWQWVASSDGNGVWEWTPTDASGNPTTIIDTFIPAVTDPGGAAQGVDGQTILIPGGLSIVVTGENGNPAFVTITDSDGTSSSIEIPVSDFTSVITIPMDDNSSVYIELAAQDNPPKDAPSAGLKGSWTWIVPTKVSKGYWLWTPSA